MWPESHYNSLFEIIFFSSCLILESDIQSNNRSMNLFDLLFLALTLSVTRLEIEQNEFLAIFVVLKLENDRKKKRISKELEIDAF